MMNLRIQQPFTSTPRRQEGSVSVLMVIALAAMTMMAALALDGGHMLLNKTRLQNAVDAAALSGAKTLSQMEGGADVDAISLATRNAALNTLMQNANAAGNSELATAIDGNEVTFATVKLSKELGGPFEYPALTTDAKYVQVSVPIYNLTGLFWNFVQSSGSLGAKAVSATATAGPSPTSPCDLAPLMVCGDPSQYDPSADMFWSFRFGQLQVLKTGAGKPTDNMSPGNYQLLDFGSGGKEVREDLAGGGKVCRNVGDEVQTAPGNKAGPTSQGLNTRFGIYDGGQISASAYPPDLVTTSSAHAITDDGTGPKYQGQPVISSNNGDLTAGGNEILDYNDWRASVAACVAGSKDCQSNGVFERRLLKIVVGDCTDRQNGSTSIPVLGFGCYFVVQPMDKGGKNSEIFGQFVKECEGDNVAGPSSSTDFGPQIIQLYKTYRKDDSGSSIPSTDS